MNERTERRRGIYSFENSYYINIDGNLKINETETRKGSAAFDITAFCGKDINKQGIKYVFTIEIDFNMRIFQSV